MLGHFDNWWAWTARRYGLSEVWDRLPKKTKDRITAFCVGYCANLVHALAKCESPIEELLVLDLINIIHRKAYESTDGYVVRSQVDITTPQGVFRVDFLVEARLGDKTVALAIECDGHNYHERTKEQAARDKRRDRALRLAGYPVIHFTGSEIWADPRRCAEEVFEHLEALAAQK